MERSRAAYRWLAVEYGYGLVDISESYGEREQVQRTAVERVLNRARVLIDPDFSQKRDCAGRSRHLEERHRIEQTIRLAVATPLDERIEQPVPAVDAALEDKALRDALSRIGGALFGGTPAAARGPLAQRLANTECAEEESVT